MIDIFVRRWVLTTVLVLIATILGGLSYAALGVRRFPQVDLPVITVYTTYQGAGPAEVETEITKRIEDAVIGIEGIEGITSSSQQGLSLVVIEFDLDEDIDIKAVEVRNKIDRILPMLPEGADDPVPEKFDISAMPVIDLALYGPQGVNELYRVADEDLEPILSQVPGVGDVALTGGQEREVHVLLEARKLRKYRIPIGLVAAALRASNVDVPAGHITQPGREYLIRTPGRVARVEELEGIAVRAGRDAVITVGDLGTVVDTYEEPRSLSRFRGNGADGALDAVVLSIQARSDANEVEVADGVYAALDDMRAKLPAEASLEVARDTSPFIRGALANVRTNMLIGIGLTALTIFLFLKSVRATFIVAIVMPVAVVIAFAGMNASGFTLNIISLTGMAIVVGVLVNNAILILENVNGFLVQGMPPREAAVTGTKDIALAIISSTATNLVVFLPIAFMGEIIGRFFRELGLTVVYATVVSLLLSFSLTPMMCGRLLKNGNSGSERSRVDLLSDYTIGWLSWAWQALFMRVKLLYLRVLDGCLAHPWTTILATFIVFVSSFGAFAVVGVEFFPPSDEGRFVIAIEAPVGTPLSATDAAVRAVEARLRDLPHLESYTVRVGKAAAVAGSRTEGVDLAEVLVTVVDRAERPETLDDILNGLRPQLADIPSAKVRLTRESHGGGEAEIAVEVIGDDLADAEYVADQVMSIVRAVDGTSGVKMSLESGQPEVHVVRRAANANRHGVRERDLANEVRSYVEGTPASQFLDGDQNYDVVVKLREQDRARVSDIARMFISSPETGALLRIDQVAEVRKTAGPALITRKDRTRLITVYGGLTGDRPLGKVLDDIRQRIDSEVAVPPGVTVNYGGEAETMQKNFAELFKAMAIAGVLTFLCIAGIIESFLLAAVILVAVPVCLIGVALWMLLYGVTVNMFSLMAMVMLVGMVVNNAIIVMEYASRDHAAGKSALEAVRRACSDRFQMILMANLTTVVALIPLSLGLGFGGEIFRPLAVVQMGGVMAAAGLSLLVIPAVYVICYDRRRKGGDEPAS